MQSADVLAGAAALGAQGPLLAYLSSQPLAGFVAFSLASVALAAALASYTGNARTRPPIREQVLSLSLGSLAMILGWLLDNGFRPLAGSGACLCGCADSLAGLGLVGRLHWMQGCMLASCAAATLVSARSHPGHLGLPALAAKAFLSCAMMISGMAASGWAAGALRFASPTATMMVSYASMSVGMLAGALCGAELVSLGRHLPVKSAPCQRLPLGEA